MAFSKKEISQMMGYSVQKSAAVLDIQYAHDLVERAKLGNVPAAIEIYKVNHNLTAYPDSVAGVKASKAIGSGADGTVTITADAEGADGNNFTITIVKAATANSAMTATISGKDITLTLGTDSGNLADATKNTATLITAAITAIEGVSAVKSGTGATAISAAAAKASFTGGVTPVFTSATAAKQVLQKAYETLFTA